jgi:g-D-glutamyl-meso-diaminopimelate peptidase
VETDHVLYDRLLSMNEGRQDFSAWRANARGVDLRRNYFAGFSEQKQKEIAAGIFAGAREGYSGESPESEPEIGHLCNFIRYQQSIQAALSLEGAGEKIYYTYRGRKTPRGQSMGESLARWSGYILASEENDETDGSLLAFCMEEKNLPCFSIRCGKEEGKIDHFYLYLQLRKMLFGAMTLI